MCIKLRIKKNLQTSILCSLIVKHLKHEVCNLYALSMLSTQVLTLDRGYARCGPPSSGGPPSFPWGWTGPGSALPPRPSGCCPGQTPPAAAPLNNTDQTQTLLCP